jgi:hypothetical protein
VCTGTKLAFCAPETSERRWCMLRCNPGDTCRDGVNYECRSAGTDGAELVDYNAEVALNGKTIDFCAPKRPPQ